MNVVISTLGLSPSTVTEFLIGLKEKKVEVDRMIIITTQGGRPSYDALRIALYWSGKKEETDGKGLKIEDFSKVEMKPIILDKEDIQNTQDCKSFRDKFRGALRNALKWTGGIKENVYVLIAGGRKTMPVDAAVLSINKGIRNIYHVVAPEVPGIATEFAQKVGDRGFCSDLKKHSENPKKAPKELIDYSLKACFPMAGQKFFLIRIPEK